MEAPGQVVAALSFGPCERPIGRSAVGAPVDPAASGRTVTVTLPGTSGPVHPILLRETSILPGLGRDDGYWK